MPAQFDSLRFAALLGLTVALMLLAWAGAAAHGDVAILAGLGLRILHVSLAAAWGGFIVFMNLIHIPAIDTSDDATRGAIVKAYVPKIASSFLHLAHGTVFSGLLLLIPTGYALSQIVYGTPVFVPAARVHMLAAGAIGGIAMWAVVILVVTPRLRQIADPATPTDVRGKSRAIVKRFARLNLALLLPVTVAMIAAAHVL